jgi:hypothetical protein|tara:strand:+ start:350 stop:619 length:270 start_codon:yes stop_codon:yes gene_type:complete
MALKLKGAQVDAPTSLATANNVSSSTVVLVQNVGTTSRLVTVVDNAVSAATIGSFNIPPNQNVRLEKSSTDEIFAANAEVKLTPIAHST